MKRYSMVLSMVVLAGATMGATRLVQAQAPQYGQNQAGQSQYAQPQAQYGQQAQQDDFQQGFQPGSQAPGMQQNTVWSADQLSNLVAPVALYPDPLLGQLLVASTYPLEVVEANQWLSRYSNLQGQALLDAAKQQPWDPSVQALVAFPDVLAKLNEDIRWTTDLGNAFLAQQGDVMNAVQQLRVRAQGNGRLQSNEQQTVRMDDQGGQQNVIIEPASPEVIYVPSYDPTYIWGPPVYGYYPPLYYSGFGFRFGRGIHLGFWFGSGWGGWGGWGWGPNWYGHSLFVNFGFFNHYGFRGYGYGFRGGNGFNGRGVWAHDAGHRLGVPYGNSHVAARFQAASAASARSSFAAGRASGFAQARNTMNANTGSRSNFSEQRSQERSSGRSAQGQSFQNQGRSAQGQSFQGRSAQGSAPRVERQQSSFRSAPQAQSFRSAPQSSAPRSSGGGSSGGGHSSGGGGGSHGGGGGSHGGGGHHG